MAISIVLVISNILQPITFGQEKIIRTTDSQKEKEAAERQELEKQTLVLLNEIVSAAWGLKLPENRVFIMSNAGDLLWTIDEKRARALYWDAVNTFNSMSLSLPATTENLSKSEKDKIAQSYYSNFGLRQGLQLHVAHRDSQLALDMLRASHQVALSLEPDFPFADERTLEQQIAGEVAARDPVRALQIAQQSLAKGLSFEALNLLYQLNQKDAEKATQFASDIIAKLQTINVATDRQASIIGIRLIESSRLHNERTLSISDEQKRTLIEIFTNAALSTSANSNLLFQMSEITPEIQQFFPERRALIERKLAAFDETSSKHQRDNSRYNTLIRGGMVEELVRTAATADDETRLSLYNQAVIIAIGQGKSDAFRDFITKEVSDSEDRQKILDSLDDEEISTAAGRKQLDALQKLLPKIRRKEERARAMAELAIMLKEKGDDEQASTFD